jgi:hypothetical protein
MPTKDQEIPEEQQWRNRTSLYSTVKPRPSSHVGRAALACHERRCEISLGLVNGIDAAQSFHIYMTSHVSFPANPRCSFLTRRAIRRVEKAITSLTSEITGKRVALVFQNNRAFNPPANGNSTCFPSLSSRRDDSGGRLKIARPVR